MTTLTTPRLLTPPIVDRKVAARPIVESPQPASHDGASARPALAAATACLIVVAACVLPVVIARVL